MKIINFIPRKVPSRRTLGISFDPMSCVFGCSFLKNGRVKEAWREVAWREEELKGTLE